LGDRSLERSKKIEVVGCAFGIYLDSRYSYLLYLLSLICDVEGGAVKGQSDKMYLADRRQESVSAPLHSISSTCMICFAVATFLGLGLQLLL